MPPYAGQFDTNAAYADVAPTKPEIVDLPATDDDASAATSEEGSTAAAATGMEMLMDFNPCVSMAKVFKARPCHLCGQNCSKLSGFVKEIEGDEKRYYHKWCGQLKTWKAVHALEWQNVMSGLLGHFEGLRLAEARRFAAEEQARLEIARRAEAARIQVEDERRAEEASQIARQAKEVKSMERQAKREESFAHKMSLKFKALKESMNCRNNKAVDEDGAQN